MPSNEPQSERAGLRHALMRKVWPTPPVPAGLDTLVVAERILSDPDLLDKLTTYRQAMRLAEHGPGGTLQDRWRGASLAARKLEHHWPADCLAEAADVLDAAQKERAAVRALADRWANQATDYDEDTEQQIEDGREILALLGEEVDSGE